MAAQIVMRARQIERAVHDPGPWTVKNHGHAYPARKVVGDDHVTFYSVVDVHHPVLELYAGGTSVQEGHLVAYRLMEDTEGLAQVAWEFLVTEPQQVAA